MGLYLLTDEESRIAFEAIERKRIERLCECDNETGFTCKRCKRIMASSAFRLGEPVDANMAYVNGKALRARRKRPQAASVATAFGTVGTTIRLRSGRYLDLLEPEPDQFTFEDIAGALSKICRFGGQVDAFYSVAEHSIHCAHQAKIDQQPLEVRRAVLLHDATEAFVGDVVKPLKQLLRDYGPIEAKLESVIARKFGVDFVKHKPAIREIDNAMLIHERKNLFSSDGQLWVGELEVRKVADEIVLHCYDSQHAEGLFRQAARWLGIAVDQ